MVPDRPFPLNFQIQPTWIRQLGRNDDAAHQVWAKTRLGSHELASCMVGHGACLFPVRDEFGRGGDSEYILIAAASGDAR